MHKHQKLKRITSIFGVFILGLAVIGSINVLLGNNSRALAGWNSGNIISDYVFTDSKSMSAREIQSFLNAKVPSCDTNGAQTSEFGGGTRRQWAASKGYSAPFTCLRNYKQNGKSAATIIYEAARDYKINPQVLLVLLQKEQGLVTDTWPLSIQYKTATGYGCPDTAACDSTYYGFTNQVRWSARMFHAIMTDSPTWYTPYVLGNNYIQYNPESSCGGSTVNIQNRATKALYNYTPYQPNQGALNAGWGTAHCGAYGNRNFFLYFTSWFGSTTISRTFVGMEDSRWMELRNDTRKVDPITGKEVDGTLSAGRQLRFASKSSFKVDDEQCLRTEADTRSNQRKCILFRDTKELDITLTPITEKDVRVVNRTFKRDLRRGTVIKGTTLPETQIVPVSAKITIGNIDYLVSKYDADRNIERGLLSEQFTNASNYEDITPAAYRLKESTPKITPSDGKAVGDSLKSGLERTYSSRVRVNNVWHYRTSHDHGLNLDAAIPQPALQKIDYEAFSAPRWMEVAKNTNKVAALADMATSTNLAKGQKLKFTSKVQINGQWYYRTESDTNTSTDKAIPSHLLKEIGYEKFVSPRKMKLSKNATKYVPARESAVGPQYDQGMSRRFSQKIYINGQWYYRTESDSKSGTDTAFKASDLEEVR